MNIRMLPRIQAVVDRRGSTFQRVVLHRKSPTGLLLRGLCPARSMILLYTCRGVSSRETSAKPQRTRGLLFLADRISQSRSIRFVKKTLRQHVLSIQEFYDTIIPHMPGLFKRTYSEVPANIQRILGLFFLASLFSIWVSEIAYAGDRPSRCSMEVTCNPGTR